MTQREKRRALRLKTTQVNIHSLYSNINHAFCFNLSAKESWELLTKISKESWYLEHGTKPADRLDKNVVKIISMEERCI